VNDTAAISAKVDLLARSFAGRLPLRYEKMHAALAQWQADGSDDAGLIELYRLLHSLAGAAGSFGYAALGAAAAVLEQRVKALLESERRDQRHINDIGLALAALQHIA